MALSPGRCLPWGGGAPARPSGSNRPGPDLAGSKTAVSTPLPERRWPSLRRVPSARPFWPLPRFQLGWGISRGRRPEGAMFLAQVAYPDCCPIMILSEASLADLNTRLEKKVKMDQFRPNIVVTGCDAFEEVRGSPLLCKKLRYAVQDSYRTAVPLSQPQHRPSTVSWEGDSPPPRVTLTWWSCPLIAVTGTSLASGGRHSPFHAWAPKQAVRAPSCSKSAPRGKVALRLRDN